MRYRATIYVDIFTDSKEEAEDHVQEIVNKIPNSFNGSIERMPHGSKISFISDIEPTNNNGWFLSPKAGEWIDTLLCTPL